jgi:hypothetical protein
MDKKLEFISTVSFVFFILSMLFVLGVENPIEFDIWGKLLLFTLVVSMLGTVVPLIISKAKE